MKTRFGSAQEARTEYVKQLLEEKRGPLTELPGAIFEGKELQLAGEAMKQHGDDEEQKAPKRSAKRQSCRRKRKQNIIKGGYSKNHEEGSVRKK